MNAASRFWHNCERYHDLAEAYERRIEYTSPKRLGGERRWCGCRWCATAVAYLSYNRSA